MSLESQIKWSVTQNKKPKPFLKGHSYREDGKANKKTHTQRYRCCRKKCRASFILYIETKKMKSSNLEHNHPEMTEGQVAAAIAKREMYEQSRDFDSDPGQIIHSVGSTLPACAHPHMPSDKTLKRTIRSITARIGPKNPTDLSELVIPEQFRKTLTGEDWLIHDSLVDPDDPQSRILVFATSKMLERVSCAEVLSCDGKFSKMPNMFKQLYTVQILHHGKTFPAVYAFLPDKEQETYTELFRVILDQIDQRAFQLACPDSIVLDFECGAINAVKDQLPQTKIMGCFFHLTQNVYRWVHASERPWGPDMYQ